MTEHKGVGGMMPGGDNDATYGVVHDVADGEVVDKECAPGGKVLKAEYYGLLVVLLR